jgi:hypothetical protein
MKVFLKNRGLVLQFLWLALLTSGLGRVALAQFSGNVQGVVTDPSGAVIQR